MKQWDFPINIKTSWFDTSNGQWYTKQQWDFPINHGRPPSDVRGCRFTCAGGVSSREQFVSGALSVIPSTTRVLYLYDVVWDLPEKWVFQTSSSFQARILCGWSFFFDDCWILTGQLWDVGWLWWLNWKSHTIPTIPWVSSEFLQVYHQFREFRYSLFQESLAAESDSSDLTLIVQRVGFSMTRTAPFFSPWLFWWPSLRFRAPLPDLPLSRVSRGRLLMAWPILGPWSLHNIID
jgi:hypothetical protein